MFCYFVFYYFYINIQKYFLRILTWCISCTVDYYIIPLLRCPSPARASIWQKAQTWVSSAAPIRVIECWTTVPPCISRWALLWVLSWQSHSLLIAYFAIHHSGYFKHPLLSKSLILFFLTLSPHHSFSDLAFNESASTYCRWTSALLVSHPSFVQMNPHRMFF